MRFDTKTGDLDRRMWVCNVRRLHCPCMSDAFLADSVDITVDNLVVHLLFSVNC